MSAFICSQQMISNLIRFEVVKNRFTPTVHDGVRTYNLTLTNDCTDLGQLLLTANFDSVNYRYREAEPCPVFVYQPKVVAHSVVQQIKHLRCLDYQCCEVPDWDKSRAYRAICSLLFSAVNYLPGFDEAKWGE